MVVAVAVPVALMVVGEITPAVGSSDVTYYTLGAVQPMAIVGPSAQKVTAAVRRIGALRSPTARIDGHGGKVDADIAIIDSGVDRDHPDLNVAGGVNCAGGSPKAFDDDNGHGTFVAGVAAARDNAIGVVGVAPGARIWAVKVTDKSGVFTSASLICGLKWVLKHRPVIDVVNMSFENPQALGKCPNPPAADPVHLAVCKLVKQGTTVVASAGNGARDATGLAMASYEEVITVSAFTDTDGRPGGKGKPPTCLPGGAMEKDDTFAFFSNYGPTVDIAAPGVCVGSTFLNGQYSNAGSGTSFSAPLVAGAAALVRARHPAWGPAQVRKAILSAATPGPVAEDPDTFAEPILNVSGF
ncbi:MAG TPA: S8 family serine peptidase [Acidimicrobiia bacterium]|nr:S8 family serine peptidase [Acidimicrobiia bacterium]